MSKNGSSNSSIRHRTANHRIQKLETNARVEKATFSDDGIYLYALARSNATTYTWYIWDLRPQQALLVGTGAVQPVMHPHYCSFLS